MDMAKNKFGLFNGISAYIIWGLLPIYWRFLEHYEADIVFSHRIIWSFVFMVLLLSFTKQITPFFKECRKIFNDRRLMWTIIAIAILISLNWLVFIWAVQNEFVLQASLGYYINPLVNVLLGVIVLREKLSRAQTIACIL